MGILDDDHNPELPPSVDAHDPHMAILHGHTFVVTSSLIQMLTARGLFPGLTFEDPHAHIAKVRSECKICVGRHNLNMDVIGLRVFPPSLTGEAAI